MKKPKHERMPMRSFVYQWATDKKFKNMFWGEECLIIGGGYRANSQKREYARCEKLDGYKGKVIGCNSSFKVRDLDILVWLDTSTYMEYGVKSDALRNFKGLMFVGSPKWDPKDLGFWAVKPSKLSKVSESFDDGIGPLNLSGYFAVNIALLLGFHIIFLTGFNSCEKHMIKRTMNFAWFKKWADENDRRIYTTDKIGATSDIFPYTDLDKVIENSKELITCEAA